jgi:hypothetical protein
MRIIIAFNLEYYAKTGTSMRIQLKISLFCFTELIGRNLPELNLHAQAFTISIERTGRKVDGRCRPQGRGWEGGEQNFYLERWRRDDGSLQGRRSGRWRCLGGHLPWHCWITRVNAPDLLVLRWRLHHKAACCGALDGGCREPTTSCGCITMVAAWVGTGERS